jgi:hypothetical protein
MACALALGLGVQLNPTWGEGWLWPQTATMSDAVIGINNAVGLILSTSFCLAAITAFVLNVSTGTVAMRALLSPACTLCLSVACS